MFIGPHSCLDQWEVGGKHDGKWAEIAWLYKPCIHTHILLLPCVTTIAHLGWHTYQPNPLLHLEKWRKDLKTFLTFVRHFGVGMNYLLDIRKL